MQRIPVTESQGRVHTSSATVNVLPEADEVEVEIEPNDLRIDVYRSTGPGGQSVNTTDSAVRITHLPTGLVVAMQDEKSQIQNRAAAMKVLRARLYELEQQKNAAALAKERRAQVGGGGRSEKIRTYNFKDNRVTDHRIGLTLKKLDRILMGDLDELVDALLGGRAEPPARRGMSPEHDSCGRPGDELGARPPARSSTPRETRWMLEEVSGLDVAALSAGARPEAAPPRLRRGCGARRAPALR